MPHDGRATNTPSLRERSDVVFSRRLPSIGSGGVPRFLSRGHVRGSRDDGVPMRRAAAPRIAGDSQQPKRCEMCVVLFLRLTSSPLRAAYLRARWPLDRFQRPLSISLSLFLEHAPHASIRFPQFGTRTALFAGGQTTIIIIISYQWLSRKTRLLARTYWNKSQETRSNARKRSRGPSILPAYLCYPTSSVLLAVDYVTARTYGVGHAGVRVKIG